MVGEEGLIQAMRDFLAERDQGEVLEILGETLWFEALTGCLGDI